LSEARAIDAQDLHHGYREGGRFHPVLRGASLSVDPGETVALVGRSGSGKSTLLNVISGLAPPSEGRVWVAGRELAGANERERTIHRRRTIGFVYQFFNLIDTLDVLGNALLPIELDRRLERGDIDRVRGLLEAVDLSERDRAWPDALSGGEQQRVALVRALAAAPRVVLADEPTGNLDAATGEHVMDLLQRLVRTPGHALLLVTHSNEVAAHADRVLQIDDGVIGVRA
jgi:putative ABC transport system ATP-binding protein